MCVKLESSLLSPPTPPSTAHLAGGDSKSGANLWWKIITVAAAARCPALREGRWCYGSGRVGKRCPRLPPAFAAPPDHPQPPWVSWQWARQLGNHPLLRWQQPASAALPKRIQGWHKLCLVPKKKKNKQSWEKHLKKNTFSTTNRALSASCWATCFISTASVNSLPKVRCVWRNTLRLCNQFKLKQFKVVVTAHCVCCFLPVKHHPRWGQMLRLFLSGPRWPVETPVLFVWWAHQRQNEPGRHIFRIG